MSAKCQKRTLRLIGLREIPSVAELAPNLGHYGANDRCDAAIAIEDGGSRSTVVDDEAVIPLIYFKEGGTRESPVVYVLHEPATHRTLPPDQFLTDPDGS